MIVTTGSIRIESQVTIPVSAIEPRFNWNNNESYFELSYLFIEQENQKQLTLNVIVCAVDFDVDLDKYKLIDSINVAGLTWFCFIEKTEPRSPYVPPKHVHEI